MKAIVIVDRNWGIGRDGGLLVHLPGDLKYFKEKTLGHTLVMGRTTLESLPKKRPLPGRRTIILTRGSAIADSITPGGAASSAANGGAASSAADGGAASSAADGGCDAVICRSLDELEEMLGDLRASDAFCAGGASVYQQLLPYCDEVLATVMEQEFDADRFFPKLPELGWTLVSASEPQQENGVIYRFCVYRRAEGASE